MGQPYWSLWLGGQFVCRYLSLLLLFPLFQCVSLASPSPPTHARPDIYHQSELTIETKQTSINHFKKLILDQRSINQHNNIIESPYLHVKDKTTSLFSFTFNTTKTKIPQTHQIISILLWITSLHKYYLLLQSQYTIH